MKDLIFGDYSDRWKYLKKVTAIAIRRFACGQKSTEMVVKEEMICLLEIFDNKVSKSFDPRLTLMIAVVNAITASVSFNNNI